MIPSLKFIDNRRNAGHRSPNEWRLAKDTFIQLVRILGIVKKFWWRQGTLCLLSLLLIPIGLLNPYFTRLAIDGPLMNKSVTQFIRLGLLMASVSFFTMMFQNYMTYLQGRVSIDVREYVTRTLYERVTQMSLDFFRRRDRNVNNNILASDGVDVVVQALQVVPEICVSVLNLVVKLIVVFVIDWRLGLIALCSPPLQAIQATVLARRNREIATVEREANLAYSKELSDSLGNIDLVKSFHTEAYHVGKFEKSLSNLSNLWRNNERFALFFGWASGLMRKIIDGLPVAFASFLVTKGSLSLGAMTASVLYTAQFIAANSKLLDYVPKLGSLTVSVNVFAQFLRTQPTVREASNAKEVTFPCGEVTIENVSFSYIQGVPVLKNVSLTIEANRWTGIKAPSGYGKTTLINLITRVYDPDKGCVLIDGYDIRKIKFKSLHDQVSAVLQQSFLTCDPIWKCIAYDKENAKRNEIEEAARIAGIHEQILGFAAGYDTVCGDAGLNISQGQRQRLTIARAILRKPRILILDEAFGSVDKETEDKIVAEMREVFPQMTVIVISHHQSVLDKMDQVIDLPRQANSLIFMEEAVR